MSIFSTIRHRQGTPHRLGQKTKVVGAAVLAAALLALSTPSAAVAQTPDLSGVAANAQRLIDAATGDHDAYSRLTELVDGFGHRFSGSVSLEQAIDWILEEMESDGLDNVRGEPVMVPHWVRGEESVTLINPRPMDLPMLALGGSIGTGPQGLTAEVMVVKSFAELTARASEARGRIVLYNAEFTNYGRTVQYRMQGAIEAARVGAVGSLIRSVGPFGIQTPHTGTMAYNDSITRIPHAAITQEHAMLLQRMADRGERVEVRLDMEAHWLPDAPSRNVVAEIVGREFPDEVIVLGGHIDSWDVGQGAMDDGGGSVAAWEAVRLMKELGLQPRRTVRVALWTNEENGLRGGNAYRDAHSDEVADHVLAMESDGGVFSPLGFGFTGSDEAFEIMQAVGHLLDPIGAGSITRGGGGADIGPIMALGVPGMGLRVDGSKYFWYHHTAGDTIDKLDPDEMARSVAAMAVIAYVIADLPERLPR